MLKFKNHIAIALMGALVALLGFQAGNMLALVAGIGVGLIATFVALNKGNELTKDQKKYDLGNIAAIAALGILCVGLCVAIFGRDLITHAFAGEERLKQTLKDNTYNGVR